MNCKCGNAATYRIIVTTPTSPYINNHYQMSWVLLACERCIPFDLQHEKVVIKNDLQIRAAERTRVPGYKPL